MSLRSFRRSRPDLWAIPSAFGFLLIRPGASNTAGRKKEKGSGTNSFFSYEQVLSPGITEKEEAEG